MDFGRVITAMVTPFDENLNVHFDYVEQFVDYLIDEQGSESLVVWDDRGVPYTDRRRKVGNV